MPHRKHFAPFLTGFYTTICDYCIAHSFVEGSLIVVSRLDHPAVVVGVTYVLEEDDGR